MEVGVELGETDGFVEAHHEMRMKDEQFEVLGAYVGSGVGSEVVGKRVGPHHVEKNA